jgi:predicted RNA binding protein YcfA (HicA-like mRNA interferase family)
MNTQMNSWLIIQILRNDGWKHVRTTGSHWHFRHPKKPGTVPHPEKDIPIGTLKSIERQAGIKFKQ